MVPNKISGTSSVTVLQTTDALMTAIVYPKLDSHLTQVNLNFTPSPLTGTRYILYDLIHHHD